MFVNLSWITLALLVHGAPAALFFRPQLTETLYGVTPDGDVGILLVHRGAMFLGIVAASVFAIFNHNSRRLASIVVAISMISFLIVYLQAGFPAGPLRKIALVDLAGLAPLAIVTWDAWRRRSA